MPKILPGETAYGIVQKAGIKPEDFLKLNPGFTAKGGKNDYMGLSGDIQPGQDYALPGSEAIKPGITPVNGSGTYIEDLTKQLQDKKDILNKAQAKGFTGSETFTADSFGNISGTSEVERAKIRKAEIDKIKAELGNGTIAPTPYKSLEEFNKLRLEKGVVNDEQELASIQNEANLGKQELRQFGATSGEGVSEGGRLGMMSEKERNLNFKLEGLALRENAVVNRLNTKNSYINNVIKLGQEDYNTALTNYNNEYTKNSKAVELYNTQLEDNQKDAMTGFTTLSNLIKDKNLDFATLSPALKAQIQTLELQAGLPEGTFEKLASAMPDAKILSPIETTNATGGKDIYFFTQSKDGTPSLVKTVSTTGPGNNPASTDFTNAEQFIKDNPKANRQELEVELKKNTKLTDSDIKSLLDKKEASTPFITKDWLKTLYTDKQLKEEAEKAGFKTGGFLGMGKSADTDAYLNNLVTLVEQYRKAGYTDQDILKLMK
jgi:hypothetical protein